ncbi:hypothetical protein [Halobacillus amylolyticus]|uniref:DUF2283 domain-containing protein n=1 Tax=Halobacillus amylolyticus TaxID=2932259 RepID=A0ABY4HG79_9BACI|nr:hypothetical protein [Halobacillus amylolyticus]UOR13377.1 hypothetical protein MUO15_07950 [Halobacillus amylolyticus]
MNRYKLDRYDGSYAILVQEDAGKSEFLVLKERLIAFAKTGDTLAIDFDSIGNLKQVQIVGKGYEKPSSEV